MISTILMATDGSEASATAERFAVGLAARTGARIHGLSVVEERFARGFREDGLMLSIAFKTEPIERLLTSFIDFIV